MFSASLINRTSDRFAVLFLQMERDVVPWIKSFAHGAMGRRIDPSWGGPIDYFSFQPVLHNWCNKGGCMCYPVCGMVIM